MGYGDIHPASALGKLLAIVLIVGGVGTFLGVVANASEILINRREQRLRQKKTNMVIGLFFTERGILPGLAPKGPWLVSLAAGAAAGGLCVVVLWLLRRTPALRRLEAWQRAVVAGWTTADSVAVAVLSGLAEEALLRALLQPIIGILGAAALFAALHFVPDRRLWAWPAFALACGLALGGLFELYGYPAAAAAHMVINLVALERLRRPAEE